MWRRKNTGRKQIRNKKQKAKHGGAGGMELLCGRVGWLSSPQTPRAFEEAMQRWTHLLMALAADLGVKLPCMLPLSLGQRGWRCP